MKTAIHFTFSIALATLAFGCVRSSTYPALEEKITAVQQKFAPDRHLAIFKVEGTQKGRAIVLTGELDNPEAKEALLKSLSELSPDVTDEITLLPEAQLREKTYGIAVVSAATIRENPEPSAELGTQVLLGNTFRIWKSQGFWSYVQSRDGYLGWIEKDQFIPCTLETATAWSNASKLIVTSSADHVWQDTGKSMPVCDVVPGCLLKKVGAEPGFFKVELADGRAGYIVESSVADFDEWKKSRHATAAAIEQTAKSLLGVPYLWGGTSTKMLDCSGFTKTVYYLNGIDLLRNASHQFRQGTAVEAGKNFENLRKGDLIFFGHKTRDGVTKVRHVGIYLDKGLFIHSSGLVHISSLYQDSDLRDEARIASFIGARRILPQ